VKTIGERIAWARKERGLTQAELAKRVGISQSAIGSYEAGHREKPRELLSIAHVLRASPRWIETGEGQWDKTDGTESQFEKLLAQYATAQGWRTRPLERWDADALPDWLRNGLGPGYVPDFEFARPGAPPVYVEVKTIMAKNLATTLPHAKLAEEHPDQYALFFLDPEKDDLGLPAFLKTLAGSPTVREDRPSFFRGASPSPTASDDDDLHAIVQGPPGHVVMEPINAWQYEDELPAGKYAMVPRLDVKLSGGHGHDGAQQLDFGFDDAQLRAYSADWVRKRGLKPNKLRVMPATGRSMERTIFEGDDLLVDLADTRIVDGAVYAIWYEGSERVKRLFRLPGGGLRITSDNKDEFPEIVLGPEYLGQVYIIGRVIDRSGPGGL
jgi:transcriptional regulator with XRE-family HTH domain